MIPIAHSNKLQAVSSVASWFIGHLGLSAVLSLLLIFNSQLGMAQDNAASLVGQALKNEASRRLEFERVFYISQERSTRTGGHLWTQRVVQLPNGVLRRLVAIDGVPLTPDQVRVEDKRIAKLVANPDSIRRGNRDRQGDDMMSVMARAFVFTYAGKDGDCTRINFAPDPAFNPSGYEERILHTLEGTVSIKESESRICEVNGRVSRTVEIGYGLLGKLEQGGQVHLTRVKTESGAWQVASFSVHMIGKMLMVRDISQNNDEVRTEFRELPVGVTVAQAAALTK